MSNNSWIERFRKLLNFGGVGATPRPKGSAQNMESGGNIWIIQLDSLNQVQITTDGGYRSPVFLPGDEAILALKGSEVLRLPVTGEEGEVLHTVQGIVKLVGFDKENQDDLLALFKDEEGKPYVVGVLSLQSGQMTPIPYDKESAEDRQMLSHIRGWERIYGNTTVYVQTETKRESAGTLEWTDVYIQQGDEEPVNLSQGDGVNCGHPSLSHDGRQVVFIKEGN